MDPYFRMSFRIKTGIQKCVKTADDSFLPQRHQQKLDQQNLMPIYKRLNVGGMNKPIFYE